MSFGEQLRLSYTPIISFSHHTVSNSSRTLCWATSCVLWSTTKGHLPLKHIPNNMTCLMGRLLSMVEHERHAPTCWATPPIKPTYLRMEMELTSGAKEPHKTCRLLNKPPVWTRSDEIVGWYLGTSIWRLEYLWFEKLLWWFKLTLPCDDFKVALVPHFKCQNLMVRFRNANLFRIFGHDLIAHCS